MAVAVLLCTRCASHCIDVLRWTSPTEATLHCTACDHTAQVQGFTVGRIWRADEAILIRDAIADAAASWEAAR